MKNQVWAYVIFGSTLVVLFAVIVKYYYAGKRESRVEEAKYKMLDD